MKTIVEELEARKVSLEGIIADSKEATSEGDLKDQNDFHDKIKQNCSWILENFELRAKARLEELEAMVTAGFDLGTAQPLS